MIHAARIVFAAALACAASGCENAVSLTPEQLDHDHGATLELSAEELASQQSAGGYVVTTTLHAETAFTRVGLMVNLKDSVDAAAEVRLEARADGGAWLPAAVAWREGRALVMNVDLPAPAVSAEVRIAAADVPLLYGLAFEAFMPSDEQASAGDIDVSAPAEEQGLAAWLANSGVRSKAAWGARESRGCSTNTVKDKIAVHHTVTGRTLNGSHEQRLRQIQSFHMDSRGYCDVGYHFLVTDDGRRWQGRPIRFLGAHVGDVNTGNVGISMVGCFHPTGCGGLGSTTPPNAMINGVARLVRTVALRHDIAMGSDRVRGHRQWAATTACPGDNVVSRLETIRTRARTNSFPQ